ncbi:hypothetical protein DSO57_1023757 [Entomophthora muscae]|uniref:Uncharacterized protein n=1 Tax=Entomophthora muscae TaxID=34485 RepID=A0ACC2TQB4_9FUNG|nr:hypothetical protein DSO57_1023757 [Entomophthora muscae]
MFIGTTNTRSMGFNTTKYTPLNTDPQAHPWSQQANLSSLWRKHVAIVALNPNINLEFIESHEDKRILIAFATNNLTKQKLCIIGVYISPQFKESKSQWETLKNIPITNITVVASDFYTWTDKLRDTFPVKDRPHHKGATMLQYMASKGLIFTLDDKEEGPATLTQWEYNIDDIPLKGSRLDYILVARALAHITSRHNL